ncbi:MAG: hypothetical protein QOE03_1590 [Micromonosporaceae bacterium]|nr:hypothetical protein [Micromonosporaceae bacterium]
MADDVNPAQPHEPTEPLAPAEPHEPAEPLAPAEPHEPAEWTEATEATEPLEPTKRIEPTKPLEPTKPIEPTKAGAFGTAGRRPRVVTAASWLLYLTATCRVVVTVVTLSQLGAMRQAYRLAFAGAPGRDAAEVLLTITTVGAAVLSVVLAVGYVVLGVFDGRGKNPARIVTWVLGAVSICGFGGGLLLGAVGGNAFGGNLSKGRPTAQQIHDAVRSALPGWYEPVVTTVGIIGVAAILAAVILLALPSANDFFRRSKPPVGGSSVPWAIS